MRTLRPLLSVSVLLIFFVSIWGCERAESVEEPSSGEATVERLNVVATTTMLADLVRQLGGDDVTVTSLVSYGADPHIYQPRPSDARAVSQSDAVVMNGLLLEGWMENLVRHAGGERPIIVAGDAIEEGQRLQVEGAVDPHIWFDAELWRQVAEHVATELKEASQIPEVVARIEERHKEYDQVLQELHRWTAEQLATIAEERRVLITSHDAFNYFGRAYGIEVEAIMGLSTEQEASQRDVANVIELVRQRNAPAVFMESSVNPALIRQVARETGARAAGPLYSDSVGTPESGAHTYVGMVQANVKMITEALGGEYQAFDLRAGAGGELASEKGEEV